MRSAVLALFASAATLLTGCVYSHTVRPLTTDFRETPVVDETASGDVKQIEYYVRVTWDTNAIGEIAKAHGFEEVYYADLERLSVLGIWTQTWAHVYGTREAPQDSAGD